MQMKGRKFIRHFLQTPSGSFDKAVYLSIHHTIHITGLEVGTVVLHAAVVEDVATNLATPFDFLLTGFHLCLLGHAVLEFLVVKHGTEKTESVLAVLGLVSCLGIFNQDFFLFARIWIIY